MRELQPWADESAVAGAFDDITSLAAACRFADCAHGGEPGCAVREAVEAGRLDADRLENFHRLGREAAYEARKHDKAAAAEHKRRWKQMHQAPEGDVPRSRSRIIFRHATCWSPVGLCAAVERERMERGLALSPRPRAGSVSRAPRDDQGPDRHRGPSRLGAARRRSVLRAGHRRATSTTTASSASSRGSGRSSASTAIRRSRRVADADDSRRSAHAVQRARHGGVRVRRAERADDAGLHRAEGSVRSAGRAGLRAVRPRRRGHGRRRRAEQRVRRDRPAAASAPASSSRCSTAATPISTASSRGSIGCFMRW